MGSNQAVPPIGSFTLGGRVSIQGNFGGDDQTIGALKSTSPLEKSAQRKSTSPAENSAPLKLTVPPEKLAKRWHVSPRPPPRLRPLKPVRYQREQVIQTRDPHRQILVVQHAETLPRTEYNEVLLYY